jgi:transcriptional regulator with XRE-family HTH domain
MHYKEVSTEYKVRLKQCLLKYKLYEVDIASLTGLTGKKISEILKDPTKTGLNILELIANAFGLRYFQFGDPKFPLPKLAQLPELTKKRIIFRKENGPPSPVEPGKYKILHLNGHLLIVLNKYKITDVFTASEVFNRLPKEIQDLIDGPSKVADRFSDGLSMYVTKTGDTVKTEGKRGPAPAYYRLTQRIPKEKIEEAQKIIGRKENPPDPLVG